MKRWIAASLAAVSIAFAGVAEAGQRYIVQAPTWGAAQHAAVAAAGGTIVQSHGSGVSVVESDDPNFLAKIQLSPAITFADQDMYLLYQQPALFTPRDMYLLDVHLLDMYLLDMYLLDMYLLDMYLLDMYLLDMYLLDMYLLQNTRAHAPAGNPLYAFQWAPRAVHAAQAWRRGYTGRGVRVAIVDGGLSATHPALAANIDRAASTSCVAGYRFDEDVGEFWHATHVAGIVAARFGGGGTLGIAPEATLIGVKVAHDGRGTFADLLCGIIAASNAHADVINLSIGTTIARNDRNERLINALAKVVDHAIKNGAVVVAAAGNDARDLDAGNMIEIPAQSGGAIAVSATGPVGSAKGPSDATHFASYSNYGNSAIGLAAPGGDIAYPGEENCTLAGFARPCWIFDMVLSTSPNGYAWRAGTSMATPVVAAVAALVKQRNPNANPAQIRSILERSAIDSGKAGNDPYYGRGFVDADRATQ